MPTMYDSETPSALPADAEIVAGYVDGQWPTYVEMANRFPHAKHVSITVEGAEGAMVGDLEVPNFNAQTIEEVAQKGAAWAKSEIAAGRRPTLYYSRDNAGIVGNALGSAGVAIADVDFWVADWTGAAHMVPGSVATQWASPGTGSGGNFDVSETNGAWPQVSAPVPTPGPGPTPGPAPAPPPTGGTITLNVNQLQSGSSGSEVKTVQSILNGKAHAGLNVDGDFGPHTESAVKAWQQFFGLAVDGIVGPATWSTLVAL